jgi:hypothetical protein
MPPMPAQGAQQPYSERPLTIYGEPYLDGHPLPIGVVIDPGDPPFFSDGQPRVLLPTGWVVVHLTDWVITHRFSGQAVAVITQEEFGDSYEAPRPLQEIEGIWVCSVNTTIQNPTNGQIRLNAATVDGATIFALHKLTDANIDYSAALETAVVGDVVYVQSAKDARRWARYTLTADAARNEDAWYRVPVVWTQGSGQSFIEGNNKLLLNLELSHRVDRTQVIP